MKRLYGGVGVSGLLWDSRGAGVEGRSDTSAFLEGQTSTEFLHHTPLTSMKNLAAMTADLIASSRGCVSPQHFQSTFKRPIMQTPSPAFHIGADIGKHEIVVACAEEHFKVRKLCNQRSALTVFLKGLPAGSRIGVEATSTYHELLAELAHERGLVVYVLNPKDTRHYAKAMGLRGKTDRVDAQMIARLLSREYEQLHPWIPPTPEQRQIDRLLKRRAKISRIRAALIQSLEGLDEFMPDLKTLKTRLDKLIERIDGKVKTLTAKNPERQRNHARLCTITGVGAVVGSSVLNTLERVPLKSADAFVAFTGLDPRPKDSGQCRGRRRLSKRGPSELRRLLYLAAMSAAKTKAWKAFYEHQRAKGLSTTAALVVLARRIARTAWSIFTHQTEFNPDRISVALT
jgi:transposase